jgi:hypothetical protein
MVRLARKNPPINALRIRQSALAMKLTRQAHVAIVGWWGHGGAIVSEGNGDGDGNGDWWWVRDKEKESPIPVTH